MVRNSQLILMVFTASLWACGAASTLSENLGDIEILDASVAGAPDGGMDAGVSDAGLSDAGLSDAGGTVPSFDAGVTIDPPESVTAIELGQFVTNGQGFTTTLSVDVDDETESMTLVALPNIRGSQVQIQNIRNPNNDVLALGDDHFSHKSRSVAGLGIQATMLPESSDFESLFVTGRYTFRIKVMRLANAFSQPTVASNVPVRVMAFKKAKVPNARHVLDINLYFTGAAGVDATAARTNGRLQNALVELENLYAAANVELGEVRYFDTPPGFDEVSSLLPQATSSTPSFADLQRLSANGPKGLNFFFVESLDVFGFGGGFSGVLGVAGGIPGPGPIIGSDRSGVVVLFDSDTWTPMSLGGQVIDEDFLGVVMAHEGGHFLGLSHTYENTGQVDNLTDTPLSSAPNATSYLMQPGATENGGIISPMQAKTIQRSALVGAVP